MENNFFNYEFEPTSDTVDDMIQKITTIFKNRNIEIIESRIQLINATSSLNNN